MPRFSAFRGRLGGLHTAFTSIWIPGIDGPTLNLISTPRERHEMYEMYEMCTSATE